jgi:DNA-binding transcriptional ArsR family regulator
MAETPDEILRALADPERLAIAGLLARTPRSSSELPRHSISRSRVSASI